MISFDYLTLKAFWKENEQFFTGARVQKIQQPTRRDFVLSIRGAGETRKLYINIDPQVFHICFLDDETAKKRNITIPKKPPMFCMLLRKHLEGFRISGVNVPEYERIFEIYFESYNELNERIELCLAVELMGKFSNVILYNRDTDIIIGCAHNVGPEKSRDRELAGTLPYTYPVSQNKADILSFNGIVDYKTLNKDFKGISTALQNEFEEHNVPLEQIKEYISLNMPLSPSTNEKEYSLYAELIENPTTYKTVNEMIDNYFADIQERIIKRALKLKLKNIVTPRYKKQKQSLEKIEKQLNKKDNAKKYKKYADLITANLYQIKDYSKEVILQDWETGENLVIPFDDKLTAKENAQKYYKLYTKSKSSKEKLIEIETEHKENISYLEQILYTINSAGTIDDLYGILSECEDIGFVDKKTDRKKDALHEIETIEENDYVIYIGKNNRQNDMIVSKISSPEDYWFHSQNCPGSHVLLKMKNKKEPDEKIIYECCKLAKKYSNASNDTKAGVIYTKRKYLRKPPKANLGYVTYKNEQEIIVDDNK